MFTLTVADRFGLEDLQKLCAVHLHSRITVDNVINIYLEAAEKLPVLGNSKYWFLCFITLNFVDKLYMP